MVNGYPQRVGGTPYYYGIYAIQEEDRQNLEDIKD
jgi:hypothetical protein